MVDVITFAGSYNDNNSNDNDRTYITPYGCYFRGTGSRSDRSVFGESLNE